MRRHSTLKAINWKLTQISSGKEKQRQTLEANETEEVQWPPLYSKAFSIYTVHWERGYKKYKTKNGRLHKTEINNKCRRKCELSIDLCFSFLTNFSFWMITLQLLKPSWFTLYTNRFNIQQFYVLPTQCIYVFCVDLRTNSDYFPIQHWLTGFYN
jgi:hypothetical protein